MYLSLNKVSNFERSIVVDLENEERERMLLRNDSAETAQCQATLQGCHLP